MNEPSWDETTAVAEAPRWEDTTDAPAPPKWEDTKSVTAPKSLADSLAQYIPEGLSVEEEVAAERKFKEEHPYIYGIPKGLIPAPRSWEDVKRITKLPMPSADAANIPQENEQWRQAVTGELGPEEQAAAIAGTAAAGLPLLHLPWAKSPITAEGVAAARPVSRQPPRLPDYATTTYDPTLAATAPAQSALTPDVIQALAEARNPPPETVPQLEATGPVAETAIEKAMRTTAEQPARTALDIAMEEKPAPGKLLIDKLQEEEAARQEAAAAAKVSPSEAAQAVAESPEATTPGDIAPGQEPAAAPRPYGVGQPADSLPGGSGGQDLGISQARTEAELGPGSVVPGEGAEIGSGLEYGRNYINKGGDPRLPIRRAVTSGIVGKNDVGIVHAELDRLRGLRNDAQAILDKDPGNPDLQKNFAAADDAQRAWRKELQPVLTKASDSLREAHAASLPPADPTTYQGLADLMDQHFKGKRVVTPQMRTALTKAAKGVKTAQEVAGMEMGNVEKKLTNEVTRRGKSVMSDTELDADLRRVVEDQFKDCALGLGG